MKHWTSSRATEQTPLRSSKELLETHDRSNSSFFWPSPSSVRKEGREQRTVAVRSSAQSINSEKVSGHVQAVPRQNCHNDHVDQIQERKRVAPKTDPKGACYKEQCNIEGNVFGCEYWVTSKNRQTTYARRNAAVFSFNSFWGFQCLSSLHQFLDVIWVHEAYTLFAQS